MNSLINRIIIIIKAHLAFAWCAFFCYKPIRYYNCIVNIYQEYKNLRPYTPSNSATILSWYKNSPGIHPRSFYRKPFGNSVLQISWFQNHLRTKSYHRWRRVERGRNGDGDYSLNKSSSTTTLCTICEYLPGAIPSVVISVSHGVCFKPVSLTNVFLRFWILSYSSLSNS